MVGNQSFTQVEETQFLSSEGAGEQTLDSFVRLWASHTPDSVAFSDASNRNEFALGSPLQLTYADLDKTVSNIAQFFIEHGLKAGDVIAIQLPNIVELPVVLLAALRAGLIPCPFPLLWRNQELDRALQVVPAKAMITIGELNGHLHSQMMCDLAFDHMSVRFVYGIGSNQTDGVTSLNDFFSDNKLDKTATNEDVATFLDQPALITWSNQQGLGLRPIYRTNRELIASGLMHVQEPKLSTSDRFLNPFPLTSLVGMSAMFMPALLIGASVIQHDPFNYDTFVKQLAAEEITYTAVPAPVLKALSENNIFQYQGKNLKGIGCVWPTPLKKQKRATLTSEPSIPVYDIHNLQETSVYISRRSDMTEQGHIKLGERRSNEPGGKGTRLLETRFRGRLKSSDGNKTYRGTLFVRGLSVPKGSGIPVKLKNNDNSLDSWTNTGIQCSIATNSNRMDRIVCEPEDGIIYHGGVKIQMDELNALYRTFVGFEDAAAVTIPDPVLGDRIWVVAKVVEILKPTLSDFSEFLREAGASPSKIPERLIIVDHIPRDSNGHVIRKEVIRKAMRAKAE